MRNKNKLHLPSCWAKRFLVVFALCCAVLKCNGYAVWDYVTLTVDVDAELVYNNHVGDDWCNRYCVIYNGKTYSCASGESMTFLYHPDAQLKIYTYICEADDANSDVGSYSQDASFSKSDICDGRWKSWTHTVYVREDAGWHMGNTAQWEVTYKFYVEPTPTPTPTSTPKPTAHPAKVIITPPPAGTTKTTPTPKPTNTPEPEETKVEASGAGKDRSAAYAVIFIVAVWLFSMGSYVVNEIEGKGRKPKKQNANIQRVKETGELRELPSSFRLVGYDEDKKTLFVVHIDDDEVIAVSHVSRREYDRLVWARERYYKRLLKRHKSKSVGWTDQ